MVKLVHVGSNYVKINTCKAKGMVITVIAFSSNGFRMLSDGVRHFCMDEQVSLQCFQSFWFHQKAPVVFICASGFVMSLSTTLLTY